MLDARGLDLPAARQQSARVLLRVGRLGSIDHAELELGRLTVFVGENGTGKTWTALGLFHILEQLRIMQPPSGRELTQHAIVGSSNVRAEARLMVEALARRPTSEHRYSVARSELTSSLPEQLVFGVAAHQWTRVLGFELPDQSDPPVLELAVSRAEFESSAAVRADLLGSLRPSVLHTELHYGQADGSMAATRWTSYPTNSSAFQPVVEDDLSALLLGWHVNARYLPAERQYLAQRFGDALDQRTRRALPRALEDFCELMARGRADGEPALLPHPLRVHLERTLAGELRFDPERGSYGFRAHAAREAVPLGGAASLVKSLAGLDRFLSGAEPGDWLIIDEPEMSAHPEAQRQLVELFALMVRASLRVVVITHSPYVLDHLALLLEASRFDARARAAVGDHFALGSPDAVVEPHTLRAHLFTREGTTKSIFEPATRELDWSSLATVSERESALLNALHDAEEELCRTEGARAR